MTNDGDMNGDGYVGLDDMQSILDHWNQDVLAGVSMLGDATGDGYVGLDDLQLVLDNWNTGTPPGLAGLLDPATETDPSLMSALLKSAYTMDLVRRSADGQSTSTIPEPTTLSLLALGLAPLLGRRRGAEKRIMRNTSANPANGRSMTMTGRLRFTAAILTGLTVASAGTRTEAAITLDLTEIDNAALLDGYTTYDLNVTTDTDWNSAAMLLQLNAGSLYQHELGAAAGPADQAMIDLVPALAFDTYVTGYVIGGAGDLGGTGMAFTNDRLDVTWYNVTPDDVGTFPIARLTLSDDADGSMSLMSRGQIFDVAITPGLSPTITERIEEPEPAIEDISTEPDEILPYDYPDGYTYPWPYNDINLRYFVPYDDRPWLEYTPPDRPDRYATFVPMGHFVDKETYLFTDRDGLIADTSESTDQPDQDQSTLPEPGMWVLISLGAPIIFRRHQPRHL